MRGGVTRLYHRLRRIPFLDQEKQRMEAYDRWMYRKLIWERCGRYNHKQVGNQPNSQEYVVRQRLTGGGWPSSRDQIGCTTLDENTTKTNVPTPQHEQSRSSQRKK